jgi:hypothetical protein
MNSVIVNLEIEARKWKVWYRKKTERRKEIRTYERTNLEKSEDHNN